MDAGIKNMIKTRQVNITLAYKPEVNVVSLAERNADGIRSKMIDLWSNSEPIMTQIPPNIVAFIEPDTQTSCVVEAQKVVITNQEVTDFGKRDLEKMLRLALHVEKLFDSNFIAYGFNYTFDFEIPKTVTPEQLHRLVNYGELKIKPEDIHGSGIVLAFKEKDLRIQIISTPKYDANLNKMNGQNFKVNIQVDEKKLPDYSKLSEDVVKYHAMALEYLNKIIK